MRVAENTSGVTLRVRSGLNDVEAELTSQCQVWMHVQPGSDPGCPNALVHLLSLPEDGYCVRLRAQQYPVQSFNQ